MRETTQEAKYHPEGHVAIEGPDLVIGGVSWRQRDEPNLLRAGLGGSPKSAADVKFAHVSIEAGARPARWVRPR